MKSLKKRHEFSAVSLMKLADFLFRVFMPIEMVLTLL